MRWFFLSGESIVKMLLTTLVIVNLFPWYLSATWLLLVLATLFLLRKNKVFYKDSLAINPDLLLSPVSGRVLSVCKLKDDPDGFNVSLRVVIPHWAPSGVFLPAAAGIEKLDRCKGQALWRWAKPSKFTNELNSYNLTLQTKACERLMIEMVKCPLGLSPRLFVQPGDKGKALACIGFIPLGGTLNIKLPASAKVMVAAGDRLKAGETAIVGL